jgi:hypothetical protein
MAEQPKQMSFNIDDGPTFFSDELSISNNQYKFYFDFKNSSPRIDVRSNEMLPIAIKHNVIIMDPQLAKLFSKLLTDHIKKFEKDHGKIPEMKAPSPLVDGHPVITSTDDRPGYFG